MLDASKVYISGSNAWDTAVHNACEEYKQRMVICVFLHSISRNHTPPGTSIGYYIFAVPGGIFMSIRSVVCS